MDYIPPGLRMASAKLSNFNTNQFRLETVSSDTAGPNRIVTVNLPETAILDLKSFKMNLDVLTTQATVGGVTVYGRLPADASSLISRVEVYLNGVQLMQGASEYNTISRILKIVRSSRDKDGSIDAALSHGRIDPQDAVEDVSLVISDWKGFLGETSTRYLDTGMLGQIQVKITFAGPEVLVPKETGRSLAQNFSNVNARTAASQVSYSVSNMFFTICSIQVDPMYQDMLRQRLSTEGSIDLLYKEYYSWTLDGITTNSHTTRFSLSSGSIDKLYATCRDSNHQTVGVRGQTMAAGAFSDTLVSNALGFRSFDSEAAKEGLLRYQWSVNNVSYPQYRAGTRDALHALSYCADKVHDSSSGNLVSSFAAYQAGMFVLPLNLSFPGEGVGVQSGYDSRGINTNMALNITGQVMPVANADAQTTAAISTFIVAETSAKLSIGLGRSAQISF